VVVGSQAPPEVTPKPPEQVPKYTPKLEKGDDLDSGSDPVSSGPSEQIGSGARPRVRGKARSYTEIFERCWKKYGRKEEKERAFDEWQKQAREFGGETNLGVLVLAALEWQAPIWAADGWRFAKYFERYLNRRKWQDEPPPKRGEGARPAAPYHAPVREPAYLADLRRWERKDPPAREPVSDTDALEPPDWMGMAERAKGTG